MAVHSSVDPGPQLPSDPSGSWKMWAIGIIVSVILPFFRSKWGPLLKLKDEAEKVVEKTELVTEVVEKVAEDVDKLAEEVENNLPAGGWLRKAVAAVDKVAKLTVKDAELVEDVIHKAEEVEKDVDSFMEGDTDKAEETTKGAEETAKGASESQN